MSLLIQPDAMMPPADWPPAEPLALTTAYEPDPFQKHAINGIHAGDHVFVTAKTGSGKTFVGEYLIARALAAGKRVFYTTPIKSLSNQKYHDLKRLFPDASIGILTGDIKMCPDAQVVVMTAEILRNLFYKRGTATEGVGLTAAVSLEGVAGVVMDEVHYIMDPDRGHVWEESLILCPRDIQLVLLSATMPSAAPLAGWLAELHGRRTWLLSTTYRVVPLVHGVLDPVVGDGDGYRVRPVLNSGGGWISDAYSGWIQARKAVADAAAAHKRAVEAKGRTGSGAATGGAYWTRADHDAQREAAATALRAGKVTVESPVARLRRTIDWLWRTGQCPALFFVFSRKECERYAAQVEGALIDTSDAAAAAHIFDFHLSRHRSMLEKSPQYHQIRELLMRGVAFHHSGLQPLLKEIVEILFTRGYVKVLFATETFAVGLNMPTKTVVFLELEKWCDGGQKRLLRPDEYIQMAGRAGRRGLDKQGLVLYQPMRDPVETYELKGLLTGALPRLESRMRFGYEFLLRVRLGGTGMRIAEESYWAVQQRASRAALEKEIRDTETKVAAGGALLSAEVEALLAEKADLEHQIADCVNAKRKKAQQALARWMAEHAHDIPKGAEERRRAAVELRSQLAGLKAEAAIWDAQPLVASAAQEARLLKWGFLAEAGDSVTLTPLDSATETSAVGDSVTLTPLGQAATEVNEGHGILMPLLAFSDQLATATASEIAIVLAAFQNEGKAPIDLPDFTPVRHPALNWLRTRAEACATDEGADCNPSYWTLNEVWPAIVRDWLTGDGLPTLAANYGVFEGNILRGLLKTANLLEEWAAIATLRADLHTLESLRSLSFLRDEVIVDSLYLRL